MHASTILLAVSILVDDTLAIKAPEDYDYGLRHFAVAGLDGDMVFSGMESKKV